MKVEIYILLDNGVPDRPRRMYLKGTLQLCDSLFSQGESGERERAIFNVFTVADTPITYEQLKAARNMLAELESRACQKITHIPRGDLNPANEDMGNRMVNTSLYTEQSRRLTHCWAWVSQITELLRREARRTLIGGNRGLDNQKTALKMSNQRSRPTRSNQN